MPVNEERTLVSRVKEIGERDASFLENSCIKVMVDDLGGMTPQLSTVQEKRQINAHWMPWFRANSKAPFSDTEHGDFWKTNLFYNVSGNFPCAPNFGPGHLVDKITMPPYGWTANLKWQYKKTGVDPESGASFSESTMESPEASMPLSFRKIDAVLPGQPVHYISLTIRNSGDKDIEINSGFHNTVGAPFLQAGCRISCAADIWTTPPIGGEFDATTRLAPGAEFIALTKAPLAVGGLVDISEVPGPIGYTDYAVGVIPRSAVLGWSSVVNPKLKLVYLCFFTGPQGTSNSEDEIILAFNNLLMQYGGRHYTPWAPWESGPDLSYCLGTMNTVSAYTYGLDYARRTKRVLASPTTVTIPAGKEKTLFYGTLFAAYEKNILDSGIVGIAFEESRLICKSATESWSFNADPTFKTLKKLKESR